LEAIDCFNGCPNLLVAVIKTYGFGVEIRQKAYDVLAKCAPALAHKFSRPM
jgi:hypothetical protein